MKGNNSFFYGLILVFLLSAFTLYIGENIALAKKSNGDKRSKKSSNLNLQELLAKKFWSCGSGWTEKFQRSISAGKCRQAERLLSKVKRKELSGRFFIGLCYFRQKKYRKALPHFKSYLSKGGELFRDHSLYYSAKVYEKVDKKRAVQFYLKVSKRSIFYWKAKRRGIELLLELSKFKMAANALALPPSYFKRFVRRKKKIKKHKKRKGKRLHKGNYQITKKKKRVEKKKFIRRIEPRPRWELFLKWQVSRELNRIGVKGAGQAAVYFARQLWIAYPLSSEAQRAAKWLKGHLKYVTEEDLLERGMRMIGMFAYRQALKILKPLAKRKNLKSKTICLLNYSLGFALFRLRKYTAGTPYLLRAKKKCRKMGSYFGVRILYYLGQSYLRRGKVFEAGKYFRALWNSYPHHFLADDAVFLLADAHQRKKNYRKASKLFSFLLKKFPSGDMTYSAIWRKAYLAYKKENYRKAIKLFGELYIKRGGKNRHRSGALYFAARSCQKLGRKYSKKALELYIRLLKSRPFSYYSSLALMRLVRYFRIRRPQLSTCFWKRKRKSDFYFCEKKRKKKRVKVSKKRKKVLNWDYISGLWGTVPAKEPILSLKTRELWKGKSSLFSSANYRRGQAFICHGLSDLARLEFRSFLNCRYKSPAYRAWSQLMKPPRSRCSPVEGERKKLALLLFFAGEYYLSQVVLRRYIRFKSEPLGEMSRGVWYLSYPRPFYPIALRESKKRKVPLYLIYAIMREESVFQEDVQSFANAYGLMQLLLSTARMEFKVWRERPFKRELQAGDLFRAEINIPLGTLHLRRLSKIFSGQLPLVAGGYNAGARWVKRWLKKNANLPLDEWVEAVTIKQTRHYIKRVLNSFVTYNLLYNAGKIYLLPSYVWPDYKFKISGRKK